MIITIDGPAGAGKSSAAKALAGRLGFEYLDTGAMYRAVTLAALRAGADPNDQETLGRLLQGLRIELRAGEVLLNEEDVTTAIRAARVTAASGAIADSPVVRRRLGDLQRQIAAGRDMVCEGRDQGTLIFPDATCKFFLVAAAEERARRRKQEMAARGEDVPWEKVLRDQEERDRRDAARDIAPMVPAPDAVIIDSTGVDLDAIVTRMEQEFRRRSPSRGTSVAKLS